MKICDRDFHCPAATWLLVALACVASLRAADLKHVWRSDHYGELSNHVLLRPAIVIDAPQ